MSAFYEKILEYQKEGKVYVMADLGSNYKSEKDLLDAIWLAKAMKIDAIKYQFFSSSELYGPKHGGKVELNKNFPLQRIAEEAKLKEIDFLCTGFSAEGYDVLNVWVDAHKVASSEMNHFRVLEKVRSFNKPIILSTGAHSMPDVVKSLEFLQADGPREVILMHANSKYPAKYSDIEKFNSVKSVAPGLLGYSDHTVSIDVVPLYFKEHGISVYEKHWNPFEYTDTPDAPQSLNNDEFKVLTALLHNEKVQYTEENEARLKFVRRIVATQDIKPGDVLREGVNMGIFRSKDGDAKGTHPFNIGRLEGQVATRSVKSLEGISIADVK